jgi:hypothetical protein
MEILISLVAVMVAFAAAVFAWPVDVRSRSADRYAIYGR